MFPGLLLPVKEAGSDDILNIWGTNFTESVRLFNFAIVWEMLFLALQLMEETKRNIWKKKGIHW